MALETCLHALRTSASPTALCGLDITKDFSASWTYASCFVDRAMLDSSVIPEEVAYSICIKCFLGAQIYQLKQTELGV